MWLWPGGGSLNVPSIPQPPTQTSLCYEVAPVCWLSLGPFCPGNLPPLTWRVNTVPYPRGTGPTSHYDVHFLVQTILGVWGGGIALWEIQGKRSPRCGPGGGLGRRKPGGIDCAVHRSRHNPLVARLCCMHWGRSRVILVGLMEFLCRPTTNRPTMCRVWVTIFF